MSRELREIHRMVETVKRDPEVGGMRIQMVEDLIRMSEEITKQAEEIAELTEEKTRQSEEITKLSDEITKLREALSQKLNGNGKLPTKC